MKVLIVYRPNSETARRVEEFAHDIERQQNVQPDLMNIDTREGAATLSLYDIYNHPAILVMRDDGQLVQQWSGEPLPLMNEVASFARG